MANSACDARASEQDLRQKLIEARAVDVMVSAGPNMFYTVALPCTLWFLDKAKATTRTDKLLFVDARHMYRQVDRAHRDWTQAQISFLANVPCASIAVRIWTSTLAAPRRKPKLRKSSARSRSTPMSSACARQPLLLKSRRRDGRWNPGR